MRLLALVLVPLLAAAAAYAHRSASLRNGWLLGAAALHLGLVGSLWARPEPPVFSDWLALDALGIVVLTVVTVLFAVVAVYAVGYQQTESRRGGRALVSCLLAFLASTSLVTLSHHLALLWVGMEATTLAMAPLVPESPTAGETAHGDVIVETFEGQQLYYALNQVFMGPAEERALRDFLQNLPAAASITITGYSDAIGSTRAKERVSRQRAAFVKGYIDQHFAGRQFTLVTKHQVLTERGKSARRVDLQVR